MPDRKAALKRRLDQARGRDRADLVIRNTRFLDVAQGILADGDVAVCGDVVVATGRDHRGRVEIDGRGAVVVPGFVDSHVHVESTLVTPAEFERCVLPHGTTTAIGDPHEIANVLGQPGIRYFLDCAGTLALDLRIQLPSCVPATPLETAGARLRVADLLPLAGHPKVLGLAEVMNVPGVLAGDDGMLDKLAAFAGRPIDGHCPLLSGRELEAYAACGVRNCHESTSADEAREKLSKGMQVLIREGSVSKDAAALAPLLTGRTWPFLAFCTDDRNPLDIADQGHLDHVIRTAIKAGAPMLDVYRAAAWSAATHFGLRDRGMVAPGWRADLVVLDDPQTCAIRAVVCGGRVVDDALLADRPRPAPPGYGSIRLDPVAPALFAVPAAGPTGPVIGVVPGSILTDALSLTLPYADGRRLPSVADDVQKVCVLARHGVNRNVGRGFVRGFGLKKGALASSVGHDSHNVAVVGVDDGDMALAVNRLIELGGGFAVVADGRVLAELALPVAGLMSPERFGVVAERLRALRQATRVLGCTLDEPLLQLAFLPLPVVPHLKITDFGLIDVDRFELVAA